MNSILEDDERLPHVILDDSDDSSERHAAPRRTRPSVASRLSVSRRRRSSFLGRRSSISTKNLNDLYRNAIRMNAENKINVSNSWSIPLIEHIDKFLEEDDDDDDTTNQSQLEPMTTSSGNGTKKDKRVNFTKASCTLDASVKIYSYRVDDGTFEKAFVLAATLQNAFSWGVYLLEISFFITLLVHLTSYKVRRR
jgi:condensin complex subunit 2